MPSANGTDGATQVMIDHKLCSGTRHCVMSLPELFVLVDGLAHVRDDVDWVRIDVDDLRRAEATCPWFAIEVTIKPSS